MSLADLTYNVRKHRRDLYDGDGVANPPITQRLASLEDHNKRVAEDLYDRDSGLVPMLRAFFAVLGEREKQKSNQLARYMAIIAGVAMLAPWVHDIVKSIFGK